MADAYSGILREERRANVRAALFAAAIIAIAGLAFYATGFFDPVRFMEGGPALGQLFSEMIPPDFSRWRFWIRPIFDTLSMSIAGTAFSVVFSLPLAILAARNTTPHPVAFRLARFVLSVLRSVPELIMGVIFVAAVGFGALPGVLALGLHSVGMVGKFYAEAIEHADPGPIEAARAAGASRFQVIVRAVLPQVLPQLADTTIYRWEYHFRASTVLGIVGAGGIGLELMAALRLIRYDQVSAILLTTLICVEIVDGLGDRLRRRLR